LNEEEISDSDEEIIMDIDPITQKSHVYDEIEDVPRYWKEVNKIEFLDNDGYGDDVSKQAILDELTNMKVNQVWSSMPKNMTPHTIPCKIFVKVKRNASGIVTKVKARMTAGGHMQRDIEDTKSYSPTSSINTVMMLCTLHTRRGSMFSILDIGAAYLNATLTDNIYMKIDADIVSYMNKLQMIDQSHIREDGSVVVKLIKALYGTKQAGRAWYNKLDTDIKGIGYEPNNIELGIYTKKMNGKISTIVIYVDDIIIMCDDKDEHMRVISQFKSLYQQVTVSGTFTDHFEFLGLNFDIKGQELKINMEGYITKILEERHDFKHADIPYSNQLFNNRLIQILDDQQQFKLRSDTAKLLYLAKRTRPDLLLSTIVMCSRANKYNEDDKNKVSNIFNYLNGTRELNLRLRDTSDGNKVTLYGHVDASYGSYDDGKGQSAYGFSFGHGMFLVKSKKQKTVGKSSTGSEIIAIDEAACEAVHLMNLLNACGFVCDNCILYEDNQSAIKIINGGIETMQKTKYMRVRIAHVKEIIEQGSVEIRYCPIEEMVVDILTKPISGKQFKKLRDMMLGHE